MTVLSEFAQRVLNDPLAYGREQHLHPQDVLDEAAKASTKAHDDAVKWGHNPICG